MNDLTKAREELGMTHGTGGLLVMGQQQGKAICLLIPTTVGSGAKQKWDNWDWSCLRLQNEGMIRLGGFRQARLTQAQL